VVRGVWQAAIDGEYSCVVLVPRASILFLCTGNSARSIMAEAIANGLYGDRLDARSAGSRPRGEVHSLALDTLNRHEVGIRGLRSKSWHEVADERFDLVVTLCESAGDEPCPTMAGAPQRAHWSLPDPPAADHPDAAFEAVYHVLDRAIGLLAAGPVGAILDRSCEAGDEISRPL